MSTPDEILEALSSDGALRLWVFEMIHANEFVNLNPQTLNYCETAFRWLRHGRHEATGETVVRGPWTQPASSDAQAHVSGRWFGDWWGQPSHAAKTR